MKNLNEIKTGRTEKNYRSVKEGEKAFETFPSFLSDGRQVVLNELEYNKDRSVTHIYEVR